MSTLLITTFNIFRYFANYKFDWLTFRTCKSVFYITKGNLLLETCQFVLTFVEYLMIYTTQEILLQKMSWCFWHSGIT